ncbi:hypothetical protein RRG08_018045 [Elysia crispata]|uniref:Uncharacterized protein n=1 Tax=Elysia crispata TaxID=231223 RepID=A0AAE1DDZ0_9GAST|nr:hypothetical protein RRG08_018045 [Elysia crispata]
MTACDTLNTLSHPLVRGQKPSGSGVRKKKEESQSMTENIFLSLPRYARYWVKGAARRVPKHDQQAERGGRGNALAHFETVDGESEQATCAGLWLTPVTFTGSRIQNLLVLNNVPAVFWFMTGASNIALALSHYQCIYIYFNRNQRLMSEHASKLIITSISPNSLIEGSMVAGAAQWVERSSLLEETGMGKGSRED